MKLVGSSTEEKFKNELRGMSAALAEHPRFAEVLLALGIPQERANTLIVLDYFPDGGADFVRVLVPNNEVVTLDLPWIDGEPVEVENPVSLNSYSRGLKRIDQIKLAVANEIAEQNQKSA